MPDRGAKVGFNRYLYVVCTLAFIHVMSGFWFDIGVVGLGWL